MGNASGTARRLVLPCGMGRWGCAPANRIGVQLAVSGQHECLFNELSLLMNLVRPPRPD